MGSLDVGLLTCIADDLNLTVDQVSWTVSCFALGVVAGSPIVAVAGHQELPY